VEAAPVDGAPVAAAAVVIAAVVGAMVVLAAWLVLDRAEQVSKQQIHLR
jgi:hypothetical protein